MYESKGLGALDFDESVDLIFFEGTVELLMLFLM
jgi:hypothetical protein